MPAILLGFARDKGLRALSPRTAAVGISLARQYLPTADTLDIFLPDMLGWTVLNNLKLDPATRHIPVQIISLEEERQHGLAHGAFAYLVKALPPRPGHGFDRIKAFVVPRVKRLLMVEDNAIERRSLSNFSAITTSRWRRSRRGGGLRACSSGPSIAWCSTSSA